MYFTYRKSRDCAYALREKLSEYINEMYMMECILMRSNKISDYCD